VISPLKNAINIHYRLVDELDLGFGYLETTLLEPSLESESLQELKIL
jgi:hypothetical protein